MRAGLEGQLRVPALGRGTGRREEGRGHGQDPVDLRELDRAVLVLAGLGRVDQRIADDDPDDPLRRDLPGQHGQVGQPLGRQVGRDGLAHRFEQARQAEQGTALDHLRAEGQQDLLLAGLAGEVGLALGSSDPRIGQGVLALEVVLADIDRPARLADDSVAPVLRVVERLLDVDVDPADRVDHLDESLEVDRRVVVDVDAEEGTDRVFERAHPAVRELVLMAGRIAQQAVQLRGKGPAVAQRHIDQVAWQRSHADRPADGIDRYHDERIGQGVVAARAGVDADEEHVHPVARAGLRADLATRSGREDPAAEDVGEGGPGDPADVLGADVGQDGQHDDDRQPGHAEAARPELEARVEERLPEGDQAPAQEDHVEQEQLVEVARDDRRGDQLRPRERPDDEPGQGDHDREWDEQREGEAPTVVVGLAETGDQRGQHGRQEAAAVGRPGVGPDPGGLAQVSVPRCDADRLAGFAASLDPRARRCPAGSGSPGRRPDMATPGGPLLPASHRPASSLRRAGPRLCCAARRPATAGSAQVRRSRCVSQALRSRHGAPLLIED